THDQSRLDWITAGKHNRYGGGRGFRRQRRRLAAGRHNYRHPIAYKFRCECGQSVELAASPTKLNYDVVAFEEPPLAQAFTERGEHTLRVLRRPAAHEPNHRHRGLLRARRERPRGRTAEQRDELAAAAHSITSLASASNLSGTVRPSTLAVVRLMMRSNLVGCSTGRAAGFAPRSILSTKLAARPHMCGQSGP